MDRRQVFVRARLPSALCLLLLVGTGSLRADASPEHPDKEETVVVYRNTQSFFTIPGWPDDLLTAVADVHIHEYPARGEVRLALDESSFIYYPDIDICAADDAFVYTIKYGDWMETFRIKLEIICDAPTIIAQFAPQSRSGESFRTFTILGVQNFPDNTLAIFDRAGKPIFRKDDYDNTWDGLLPDGSYAKPEDEFLYVFDDGLGNLYSGYLRIE